MQILAVDPEHPSPDVLERAAALLRAGALVAFPTETVYGLGANALDADAVQRIYAAKGRPSYNPLIVHVADTDAARQVARAWPERAARLAARFWPGPLTLVVPKRPEVPDAVTGGLDTVAVRVPAHPVALALLRTVGLPIAAPSANPSTRISPTTAQHVAKALGDRVSLVLDAGPTTVGIESTVLDISGDEPVLLRPGMISAAQLAEVVGEVLTPEAAPADGEARRSPGMMARHYAPRARVLLVSAENEPMAHFAVREEHQRGATVGALLRTMELPADRRVRMPDEPGAYAQRLYGALHELDDAGCALIVVERVPDSPAWAAVRDRLERSAR